MIIINAKLDGENTYEITVNGIDTYKVFAFNLESAIDRVADYIEEHKQKDAYLERFTVELMAECSQCQTPEAFAKVHKLTKCGTNGIYLEITNVKGCPNG